jgi:hypothetical protein
VGRPFQVELPSHFLALFLVEEVVRDHGHGGEERGGLRGTAAAVSRGYDLHTGLRRLPVVGAVAGAVVSAVVRCCRCFWRVGALPPELPVNFDGRAGLDSVWTACRNKIQGRKGQSTCTTSATNLELGLAKSGPRTHPASLE